MILKGPNLMTELYKFPTNFVSDQFVEYIDEDEIFTLTKSLAHTISQRYRGEDLVVVGVLKGSMIFISDFLKNIKDVKVYLDFVKLKAIGRSKESNGTITVAKDIKTNIQGKNVLIVKQILDTGRGLQFLVNHLKQNNPRNIEVLTLFDKPYKRAVPIKPDYIGKQIEDQFIVGYGVDLDEYGRNIKDLYYLKYPN